MADEQSILPDSIRKIPAMQVLDLLFAARLKAIEIENLLIFMVDTAPSSVLPYLADQFGIAGNSGWLTAETEEEKRNIIKNGINLNRKKGTVYAIKEVVKSVGYEDAVLREGIEGAWVNFDVLVDLGESKGLDGNVVSKLTKLINEYKNVRSNLLGISFTSNVIDEFSYTEDFELNFGEDLEDGVGYKYDGSFKFDGSHKFENIDSILEFIEESNPEEDLSTYQYDGSLQFSGFHKFDAIGSDIEFIEESNPEDLSGFPFEDSIEFIEEYNPAEDLFTYQYDGSFKFDGSHKFDGTGSAIEFTGEANQEDHLLTFKYDGSFQFDGSRKFESISSAIYFIEGFEPQYDTWLRFEKKYDGSFKYDGSRKFDDANDNLIFNP